MSFEVTIPNCGNCCGCPAYLCGDYAPPFGSWEYFDGLCYWAAGYSPPTLEASRMAESKGALIFPSVGEMWLVPISIEENPTTGTHLPGMVQFRCIFRPGDHVVVDYAAAFSVVTGNTISSAGGAFGLLSIDNPSPSNPFTIEPDSGNPTNVDDEEFIDPYTHYSDRQYIPPPSPSPSSPSTGFNVRVFAEEKNTWPSIFESYPVSPFTIGGSLGFRFPTTQPGQICLTVRVRTDRDIPTGAGTGTGHLTAPVKYHLYDANGDPVSWLSRIREADAPP